MVRTGSTRLEVRQAKLADVPAIQRLIARAYPELPGYTAGVVRGQLNNFPEGQFVAIFNGKMVGYCASMRISGAIALKPHDWDEITGNGFGSRHDPTGNWLYGYEMCVDPKQRGLRIGQRLYDTRKTLAERLELSGIAFGGRMPGYARVRRKVDGPEDYLQKVVEGKLRDPVIGFQLHNGYE
ncbi:MAG: GNAT family N-acetyltransferase, partial [Sphingomonadaceae bacterium]